MKRPNYTRLISASIYESISGWTYGIVPHWIIIGFRILETLIFNLKIEQWLLGVDMVTQNSIVAELYRIWILIWCRYLINRVNSPRSLFCMLSLLAHDQNKWTYVAEGLSIGTLESARSPTMQSCSST